MIYDFTQSIMASGAKIYDFTQSIMASGAKRTVTTA